MTIEPITHHLVIYQGATFSQTFIWKDENNTPINLTGYTARMMARTSLDAPTPFIHLTTENGGIALGGSAGTVILSMSAAATAAIVENVGLYDLELAAPGGDIVRFIQGPLTISREVTR